MSTSRTPYKRGERSDCKDHVLLYSSRKRQKKDSSQNEIIRERERERERDTKVVSIESSHNHGNGAPHRRHGQYKPRSPDVLKMKSDIMLELYHGKSSLGADKAQKVAAGWNLVLVRLFKLFKLYGPLVVG